ncbi:MAG: hypothetical protein AB8G17_00735, partial [Gammaproteobacteria bacterium]
PVKLWLARALELLSEQPSHPASWLLPRLRAQAHELEGVAENDIELMRPNDLLARYAPPPWPASAPEQTVQRPADGLFKPMRWLAEQSGQQQEEGE